MLCKLSGVHELDVRKLHTRGFQQESHFFKGTVCPPLFFNEVYAMNFEQSRTTGTGIALQSLNATPMGMAQGRFEVAVAHDVQNSVRSLRRVEVGLLAGDDATRCAAAFVAQARGHHDSRAGVCPR